MDVQRVDIKPFCVELEIKDKLIYFAFRSDEEVYGWMEDIYSRSPLMGVSQPTNFVHQVHVGFDPVSGGFTVCGNAVNLELTFAGTSTAVVETSDLVGYHQGGGRSSSRSRPGRSAVLHKPADDAIRLHTPGDFVN